MANSMQYLQRARDVAEAHGYLDCPEVRALRGRVPGWFRALGTDAGVAEFEAQRAIRLPAALREFYRCTTLACFVEAAVDGEVFLNALGEIVGPDLPPVVAWPTGPHIVLSFHNHSGTVLAAEVGQDDPNVFAGFDDEPKPFLEEDWPTRSFSDLIFGIVEGHEATLDYWLGVYEKGRSSRTGFAVLGRSSRTGFAVLAPRRSSRTGFAVLAPLACPGNLG